jgi:hypothetical protein
MALRRGCCCTKRVIEALTMTVGGSEKDGNPSENSARVKAAATEALAHCLSCYHETATEEPKEKPKEPPETIGTMSQAVPPAAAPQKLPEAVQNSEPGSVKPGKQPSEIPALEPKDLRLTTYYTQVQAQPTQEVIHRARQSLEANVAATAVQTNIVKPLPTGQRSLYQIWQNAFGGSSPAAVEVDSVKVYQQTSAPIQPR